MILQVSDPDDPRIAGFRQVRERDLVGREGLFVAEGEVVLHHLLTSPLVEPVAVLLAGKRVEKLSAGVPDDVPVYAADQAVIDAIAGFHLHRGILALGRRRDPPTAEALLAGLGGRALVVCAFGIGNHDNMGGLFRNAAAFGADAVLIGEDCCDPMYRKAIRVSVGATLIKPWARIAGDPLALLAEQEFEVLSLTPSGAMELADVRRGPRTAVMFGSEGPGLPADLLARTKTVRITMQTGFDSLNVATTSGIVLHQLTRG